MQKTSGRMKLVGRIPRAALANGAMVRLPYPPYDVLVAEVDGHPVAIEDACNHAGASLTEGWRVDPTTLEESPTGANIVCPVHGYIFSLETGHLLQPPRLCDHQRTFKTRLEDQDVIIEDAFQLVVLGP